MITGVNKKLLETLKGDELTKDTLRPCIASFRALLESNLSPDLLRSLALSITYNLHRPKPPSALQKKKSIRFAPSSSRPPSSKSDSGKHVSSITLGIEMLRLYSSILCNSLDPTPLRKFAKAVTNKVCLGIGRIIGLRLTPYIVASISFLRRRA
jgi:hypothetical protein